MIAIQGQERSCSDGKNSTETHAHHVHQGFRFCVCESTEIRLIARGILIWRRGSVRSLCVRLFPPAPHAGSRLSVTVDRLISIDFPAKPRSGGNVRDVDLPGFAAREPVVLSACLCSRRLFRGFAPDLDRVERDSGSRGLSVAGPDSFGTKPAGYRTILQRFGSVRGNGARMGLARRVAQNWQTAEQPRPRIYNSRSGAHCCSRRRQHACGERGFWVIDANPAARLTEPSRRTFSPRKRIKESGMDHI